MAYFIHNKYDKNSIAALALIDQGANTVIDYYGNYDTYNTSMFQLVSVNYMIHYLI